MKGLDHDNIIKVPTPSKYNHVNASKAKEEENRMKHTHMKHEHEKFVTASIG